MGRLSSAERRRVAAGVAGGLIAALLGILFWVLWGGDPLTTEALLEPRDSVRAPAAPGERRPDPLDPRPIGPLVGAREQRIQQRLAALAPRSPRRLRALDFRVGDVTWREPARGPVWARAAGFSGRLDLGAAGRGDIVVTGATLTRPRIALRQDARGRWNYEDVFAEILEGEPAPGPARLFTVRNVQVVDGHVDVRMPDRTFALESLDVRIATLDFSDPAGGEPRALVSAGTGTLHFPADARRLPVRLADARVRFPAGSVFLDVAEATVAGARFADVSGEFSERIPGNGLRIAGRASDIDIAAFDFLLPEALPPVGTASFAFAVEPLTDVQTRITLSDLDYAADGSRVLGALTLHIQPERFEVRSAALRLEPLQLALLEPFTGPIPYGGALTGTITGSDGDIAFDIVARLTAPELAVPFSTRLTGRALMSPAGVALQRLEAELRGVPLAALRPVAPGLPLRGAVSGTVVLTGMPTESPLQLDVRLELAAGVFNVAGMLDISGDVPRYDVSGRIIGVSLQALLQPDVPPVTVTARFSAAGSGFDPATADAQVTLEGRFTGWQTGPADSVRVVARVREGSIAVQPLTLDLATLELRADGTWRFLEPVAGSVRYELTVADVRPFGPYVPALGDTLAAGSLRAQGAISGTLAQFRLEGDAQATALRFGGWSAAAVEAEYAVAFVDELPELMLDAHALRLETPTAGTFENAIATMRLTAPLFTLDVRAERLDGTGINVAAEGRLPPEGPRELLLQHARFDIEQQRWALARPARIAWGGVEGIHVADFELQDLEGPGRIRIDGTVLPLGSLDARLALEALPLAELQRLAGRDPIVTGLLWSTIDIRAPGGTPVMDADFRLDDGRLQDVPVTQFEGSVRYADDRLDARALLSLADAGTFELVAAVPVTISLADSVEFALLENAPLSARASADSLALAPLGQLSLYVADLQGFVHGGLEASGTAANPVLAGRFELRDGAVRIPALDTRYVDGFADVELRGREIVVHDVRARAAGWAQLSGLITLESLTEPVIDLTTQLEGFRAVGAGARAGAAVYGQVRVRGAAADPVLTGRLLFEDGTLVLPEFRPELDVALDAGGEPLVFDDQLLFPAPAPPAWHDAIRVQGLALAFGDNLWIDGFDARVQLSGELTVDRAGENLVVTGTLEGSRGQYVLAAGPIVRRFDIANAQVRFLGTGELNPQIDFTARRRVIDPGGRHLDIDVRVGGTARNPTLSLASQDAVMIPQSELLSFLLFGQPSFALGGGALPGEALLEQTFVGGLAEMASLELEQTLVRDFGLPVDMLQIHFGSAGFGGFGTPVLFLGREVTRNVYLTVETGLGALFATETEGGTQTWAIRLEWAIDNRMTLRGGYEPVQRHRLVRGLRFALPTTRPLQQLSIELRRRWYY